MIPVTIRIPKVLRLDGAVLLIRWDACAEGEAQHEGNGHAHHRRCDKRCGGVQHTTSVGGGTNSWARGKQAAAMEGAGMQEAAFEELVCGSTRLRKGELVARVAAASSPARTRVEPGPTNLATRRTPQMLLRQAGGR